MTSEKKHRGMGIEVEEEGKMAQGIQPGESRESHGERTKINNKFILGRGGLKSSNVCKRIRRGGDAVNFLPLFSINKKNTMSREGKMAIDNALTGHRLGISEMD
jgi:hypothetical protein